MSGTTSRPEAFRSVVIFLVLTTAVPYGCASVSYKAGGSSRDYEAASDRCQKQGRMQSADFARCMDEQGWTVKPLGGQAASHAPEAPAAVAGDVQDEAPAAAPEVTRSQPAAMPTPAARVVAPAAEIPELPPVAAPTTPQPTSTPTTVNNWFKLGGTADGLAAAKQRCAAKVGGSGQAATDVVSAEMLDCLRDEGWRPF